jgi:hypothetical protein
MRSKIIHCIALERWRLGIENLENQFLLEMAFIFNEVNACTYLACFFSHALEQNISPWTLIKVKHSIYILSDCVCQFPFLFFRSSRELCLELCFGRIVDIFSMAYRIYLRTSNVTQVIRHAIALIRSLWKVLGIFT